MIRRCLPVAVAVTVLGVPGVAGAAALDAIGVGWTPAASDGTRYAVWLAETGELVVRDSVRRRTVVHARFCPGPQRRSASVRAGLRIAAVQCLANGIARRFVVDLRTGRILPIALPGDPAVSVIGRYWIGSHFVRPAVYVHRTTGEVRYGHDAPFPPLLDPDSPDLAPLPSRPGVARLLLSGEPLTLPLGPGMVVRDPRIGRDTRVVRECRTSCGPPFGRVGRLTYVQEQNGKKVVRLLLKGRAPRRWEVPHPRSDLDGASEVIAKVTNRELVVSVTRGVGNELYDISATTASSTKK